MQLPGGYTFAFPRAQSLHATFTIQIESDYAGNGGLVTNIRVPLDDAAVDAVGAGNPFLNVGLRQAFRKTVLALQAA